MLLIESADVTDRASLGAIARGTVRACNGRRPELDDLERLDAVVGSSKGAWHPRAPSR